jgi:pimeloyl-ACP methyl ester carboxylesterase
LFIAGSFMVAVLARPLVQRRARPHPRFVFSNRPLSKEAYANLAARPGWNATSIHVAENVDLNGLIRRPMGRESPWVLFFPGNDATQLATGQKLLEGIRDKHDWGLAVYSYRGFDSSPGAPERDALASDAIQIVDTLLQREQIRPSQVHVVAFSLGGYLAAHVVGQASKIGNKLASLTLLASVENMEMVRSAFRARLAIGDIYEIAPFLADVPAPVLVIQGAADEAFGCIQGRTIAAQLGNRARYLELPGVGHSALLENENAIVIIREMIEQVIRVP